ncbi:DinB family protein [Salegentibacter chungangensis]|uniref:DinB family protein n=1 Tax=Salegentibacter chungangensis TaxID=1335724 RepID=A0ABW3NU38_9FLAO
MTLNQIDSSHYNVFYQGYIDLIPKDKSLTELLEENRKELRELFKKLSEDKLAFRYAPEKWSIAELLQHLIDVERIFQYRALSIARKDKTSLPGFDHDAYVPASEAEHRSLKDLETEFLVVRESTILLFKSFSEEMLLRIGSMNAAPASPAAIGFIITGHTKHHLKILKERYLR